MAGGWDWGIVCFNVGRVGGGDMGGIFTCRWGWEW